MRKYFVQYKYAFIIITLLFSQMESGGFDQSDGGCFWLNKNSGIFSRTSSDTYNNNQIL